MKKLQYEPFFQSKIWKKTAIEVCQKLQKESVILTSLPDGGITFFMKYIEEAYPTVTNDKNSIIISLEIVQQQTEIQHLSSEIKELINNKLNSPTYLSGLNCKETFRKLIKNGKKIIISINRFERLINNPETLSFLNSLRAVNPLKIRFLISSYIDFLTYPQKFTSAGMLTSVNVIFLPTFDMEGMKNLLQTYKDLFRWDIPTKHSKDILRLSGGFPGFIKYITKYIHEKKPRKLTIQSLYKTPSLQFKIKNMIKVLQNNKLLKSNKLNLKKKDLLFKLGVIDNKNNLKITILQPYISDKKQKLHKRDLYNLLTPQELKLFDSLNAKFGKVILLDEIAKILWGEHASVKYSLWSIYKIISNLKRKLEKYGYKIKSYRGRGYTLVKS